MKNCPLCHWCGWLPDDYPGEKGGETKMIEMTVESLAAQPFLRGMTRADLAVLAEYAQVVTFPAGARIFREGGNATRFWLIRSGRVALDANLPGGRCRIGSLGIGDLLGWSWLIPPYQWANGAVAAGPVEAVEFDATAVRALCAAHPALGYQLTQRVARVLADRLRLARMTMAHAAAE